MKFRSILSALVMVAALAFAPAAHAQLQTVQLAPNDPCFSSLPVSNVSVSISTATTTQLVALTAGKKVYVCGFSATIGASTTAALEYGTGSACATGTTALTGAFAGSAFVALGRMHSIGNTATANALCLLSTGTGGIQGVLTYIVK